MNPRGAARGSVALDVLRTSHQNRRRDREAGGKRNDRTQAHVLLSTFDRAEVLRTDAGQRAQLLLRHRGPSAKYAYGMAEGSRKHHGPCFAVVATLRDANAGSLQ